MLVGHFLKVNLILTSPYMTIKNTNSSIDCAALCTMDYDCCGITLEYSTMNCILFYYQTSNNCETIPGENTVLAYKKMLTDCSDLRSESSSGVYRIYPSRQTAVLVYCEMTDAGGGWTVLQRRQDGSEDFYTYWADYKNGFGDLENEFWLGNDNIHEITSHRRYKVRFDLESFDNQTVYAEFDKFYVEDESFAYAMNISGYSGTAGDGMYNYGYLGPVPFSTRDVDNDKMPYSCAVDYKKSGWWFIQCTYGNINGMYKPGVNDQTTIHWRPWREYECLKKARMMIKPS